MLKKQYLKSKPVVKVTFSFPGDQASETVQAKSVQLVGDFNNWSDPTPMKRQKDGRFSVLLELEKDRAYQFRYLVDGQEWYNDWQADQYVANPFNSENSVVLT
jgi:1,4-alpha-glucan branching enzyme